MVGMNSRYEVFKQSLSHAVLRLIKSLNSLVNVTKLNQVRRNVVVHFEVLKLVHHNLIIKLGLFKFLYDFIDEWSFALEYFPFLK